MPPVPSIALSSGTSIPVVGLGVYKAPAEETYAAVMSALQLGYRHIDTAQAYGNEAEVGRAVRESSLPRAEIFVTTKLWRSNWGYDKATAAIQGSVQAMGLEYVDLFLLHCPGDSATRAETWRAMEDTVKKGLTKSLGVSNFGIPHLEKLMQTATIKPVLNQLELSPYLQRRELVDYCKAQGIALEAYSPLAKATKLSDPKLVAMAGKRGITTAQLLIRWSIQHGFIPLPKSVHPERQASNLDVFGFELDAEEMAQLDAMEEGLITGWDPVTSDPV